MITRRNFFRSALLAAVAAIAAPLAEVVLTQAQITPDYIEMTLRQALAGNHAAAWRLYDLMIDTDPQTESSYGTYSTEITLLQ